MRDAIKDSAGRRGYNVNALPFLLFEGFFRTLSSGSCSPSYSICKKVTRKAVHVLPSTLIDGHKLLDEKKKQETRKKTFSK